MYIYICIYIYVYIYIYIYIYMFIMKMWFFARNIVCDCVIICNANETHHHNDIIIKLGQIYYYNNKKSAAMPVPSRKVWQDDIGISYLTEMQHSHFLKSSCDIGSPSMDPLGGVWGLSRHSLSLVNLMLLF